MNNEKILNPKDVKLFDKMYEYIRIYNLNKLKTELDEFMNDDNGRVLKKSNLDEQLKIMKKSQKYGFCDRDRYAKFYNRIREKININLKENKELIKEELIRLKSESENNDSIELTSIEIEELIQQINVLIKEDN